MLSSYLAPAGGLPREELDLRVDDDARRGCDRAPGLRAFWATGISPVDVSYGDPPLVQPDEFAALLAQQFAFRPGYAADPARLRP